MQRSGEGGQASVEWIGLLLLVALAGAASATALMGHVPALGLVRALAAKLVCAADLAGDCQDAGDPALVTQYGTELAALVRGAAPTISYEEDMNALPVDFRRCREDPCSLGAPSGDVSATDDGHPVTLFVHVVDCRPSGAAEAGDEGFDCSGERAGNAYLQYWAYYPGSQSLRLLKALDNPGFHADDWEGFQVRVGPDGRAARATSHHGYNWAGGAGSWLSDAGLAHSSAWGPDLDRYYVSGGSHAGHAFDSDGKPLRWTSGSAIRLIPIESLAAPWKRARFAITPPWEKDVYFDPEDTGTN